MGSKRNIVGVAQALADPIRLAIVQHLMGGPATVSQMVSTLGEAQSKVSNHLALLRQSGLLNPTRQGRQIVYDLCDASVAALVESLSAVVGVNPEPTRKTAPLTNARTCYDHLAGRLGVALFDALVSRGGIVAPQPQPTAGQKSQQGWPRLELGPAAQEIFRRVGIDLDEALRERRRFATACLDWTERRPHLGGALGAELYVKCVERGWIVKRRGTRLVSVTPSGRRGFRRYLGVELDVRSTSVSTTPREAYDA
jgi:DNA-binding transcriptional ArsR family regulator